MHMPLLHDHQRQAAPHLRLQVVGLHAQDLLHQPTCALLGLGVQVEGRQVQQRRGLSGCALLHLLSQVRAGQGRPDQGPWLTTEAMQTHAHACHT